VTSIVAVRGTGCAIERVAAIGAAHEPLDEARRERPPRRVKLVGAQPFLGQRKDVLADDRRHRDRDPIFRRALVPGAVTRGQAATQADRAGDPPALCGRGFTEACLALVGGIAQHLPHRRAPPATASLAGRNPLFVQHLDNGADAETRNAVELEYPPHHPSLLVVDLVVCGRVLRLADKAVSEGSPAEHADFSQPSAMPLAAPRALDNLRSFVLGDHALELHQQLILGRRATRRANKQSLNAGASKLLDQKNLICVPSAQPIGRIDQNHLNQSLGGKIADPLQARADQVRPTNPVVLDHPFRQHFELTRAGECDQCRSLTRDRVLLALLVRRHPSVDRCRPHRLLPSPLRRR
jgi:hypothetical protein